MEQQRHDAEDARVEPCDSVHERLQEPPKGLVDVDVHEREHVVEMAHREPAKRCGVEEVLVVVPNEHELPVARRIQKRQRVARKRSDAKRRDGAMERHGEQRWRRIDVRSSPRYRRYTIAMLFMVKIGDTCIPIGLYLEDVCPLVKTRCRESTAAGMVVNNPATMANIATKRLPSGAAIPTFGLGVYKSKKGKETYEAVLSALQLGYRHIDTAQWYRNEADVGRAVKDSGVPREQVFLTTKLWMTEWGYDKATAAVLQCNERLGGSYIDLMLLHAPGDSTTRAETWRALEDLRAKGVVRDIGVSNFGQAHLEKLFETVRIKPAVNQIELHPWLTRADLVAFCRQHEILVEAYSPLAKGSKFDDPELLAIADELQATPAQVLLAYSVAKDFITIPKSVQGARQSENLAALALALRPQHVVRLDGLDAGLVVAWDPITRHAV